MKETIVPRPQHVVLAVYTDTEKNSAKCMSILFHSYPTEQCEFSNPAEVRDCFFFILISRPHQCLSLFVNYITPVFINLYF